MLAVALSDFLDAVSSSSQRYASQYGLTPEELQIALITTAGLEGGLGDTPGVGDGGQSHGRFQFYTGGGHGSTLLNQGWTIEDFYDDRKVVEHWAPLLAQSVANAKAQGYTGAEAIRQGAFALERPAAIYPVERFNSVLSQATGLAGGAPIPPSAGGDAPGTQGGGAFDLSQFDIPALPFSTADYYGKLARWNALDRALGQYEADWEAYADALSEYESSSGFDLAGNPIAPPEEPVSPLTPEEEAEYYSLSDALDQWEGIYDQQGQDLDRLLTLLDHYSDTDPRLIDAENAADRFNREYDIRQQARQMADTQYTEETERQKAAVESTAAFMRKETPSAMVPYKKLTPYAEFFNQARETVAAGMPEVPDKPYPFQLSGAQAGAFGRPMSPGANRAAATNAGPQITDRGRQRAEEGEATDNRRRTVVDIQTRGRAAVQRIIDPIFGRRQSPVRDTSAFKLMDDLASRRYGPPTPGGGTVQALPTRPAPNRGVAPQPQRTITPQIVR